MAVLDKEGVNQKIKIHTNLREYILTLLPKVYSIPMVIGSSSVSNSIVKFTKRTWKINVLISELHQQDLNSNTTDMRSSARSSCLPLEHKYMKLSMKKNRCAHTTSTPTNAIDPINLSNRYNSLSQSSGKRFGRKLSRYRPS